MQWQQGSYVISTDKSQLDIPLIYDILSNSYWAKGMPKETLAAAINGAMCFGLYDNSSGNFNDNLGESLGDNLSLSGQKSPPQIGFARVITDSATFAYLADVFIVEQYQGAGLGKWLMKCVFAHPSLQGLRRMMLATADAHGLYQQSGFTALKMPERFMELHDPDVYKNR
ncbi:MAG: GNAT superfamily N-acetyltransferase [Phenylobacterium sp.]|jgi:GNAT superfamily N-acetyltransferase